MNTVDVRFTVSTGRWVVALAMAVAQIAAGVSCSGGGSNSDSDAQDQHAVWEVKDCEVGEAWDSRWELFSPEVDGLESPDIALDAESVDGPVDAWPDEQVSSDVELVLPPDVQETEEADLWDLAETCDLCQDEVSDLQDTETGDGLDVDPDQAESLFDAEDITPDVCVPVCGMSICGEDGCGGLCGECAAGFTCQWGECFSATAGEFSLILPGTFTMGHSAEETCVDPDEIPHQVTLTRAYFVKTTEVTQAEYEAVMIDSPFYFANCGEKCPAENMNWVEAVTYCNYLSAQDGLLPCYVIAGEKVTWPEGLDCEGYRLPTDAEWEYAVRAESTTAYYNGIQTDCQCGPDFGFPNTDYCACGEEPGLEQIAWFCQNSTVLWDGCFEIDDDDGVVVDCLGPHPVGLLTPNQWGLYDVSGNVWEWVWDIFMDDYDPYYALDAVDPLGPEYDSLLVNRAAKGGAWHSPSKYCRTANRLNVSPYKGHPNKGFRIARTAQQ